MKRRVAVVAAGAVALAAGASVGVWRSGRPGPGSVDAASAFWSRRFASLEGVPLVATDLRGKPLLLNLWATWCPPCVKEMPLLDAFAASHADWHVLALAIDGAEPVRRFVREQKIVRMRIALATDDGPELARALGNGAGGLPYSLRFDASGALTDKHLGALDAQILERWAKSGPTSQ